MNNNYQSLKNDATAKTVNSAIMSFLNQLPDKAKRIHFLRQFYALSEADILNFNMPLSSFSVLDHNELVSQVKDQGTARLYSEFANFALNY